MTVKKHKNVVKRKALTHEAVECEKAVGFLSSAEKPASAGSWRNRSSH